MKKLIIAAMSAASVLVLAGCSNSDFISLAEGEGITVHRPDLARATVGDLCKSLDDGPNPMAALFQVGAKRMNDPALSTNDERLVQLGIEGQCSQHSEAIAGLAAMMGGSTETEQPPAPVELDFGARHTFADGVTISASAPELQEGLGCYPGVDTPVSAARVALTVDNGSQSEISPGGYYGTATLNGQPIESPSVDWESEGLRGAGEFLLPGQAQTFDELHWVTEPGDLIVSYSSGGESVYYRTEVGADLVTEQVNTPDCYEDGVQPAPAAVEEEIPFERPGGDGFESDGLESACSDGTASEYECFGTSDGSNGGSLSDPGNDGYSPEGVGVDPAEPEYIYCAEQDLYIPAEDC